MLRKKFGASNMALLRNKVSGKAPQSPSNGAPEGRMKALKMRVKDKY